MLELLAHEFAVSAFDSRHLLRCIYLTRAYQRTSRPLAGNAADKTGLSHMNIKVITPEQLHDSLCVGLSDLAKSC